jgi:hypothetical protein
MRNPTNRPWVPPVVTPLRGIIAEWRNLGNECPDGVPVGRLIDIRHKLTANIKFNLYRGGDRNEGRSALEARYELDDFLFNAEQTPNIGKKAVTIDTFLELLEILDHARETGSSYWREGARDGHEAVADEPIPRKRVMSGRKQVIARPHGAPFAEAPQGGNISRSWRPEKGILCYGRKRAMSKCAIGSKI